MLKKIAISAALGLGAFAFVACDSLLDTQPRQSVSPEVALEDISGVRGIVTSAYNRLLSEAAYVNTRVAAPEVLADNGVQNPQGNPSGRYVSEETNAVGTGVGGWGLYSALINDVNYVIADIDITEAPQGEKDNLKAQSLFLRALAYHDLVKTYGYEPGREQGGFDLGIVLRTSPTRGTTDADTPRPRSTNVEVYQQIEQDLLEAISLFQTATGSPSRFLANRAAAEALLSRVYLFWGQHQNVIPHATNAMENPLGASLANPNQVAGMFASTSTTPNREAFFEIRVTTTDYGNGVNGSLAALFTPEQWFDIVPSNELKELYEEGDRRFLVNDEGVISGWYSNRDRADRVVQTYTTKFMQTVDGIGQYTDNTPIIRFGEVLLNRAEAYANLGQDGPALNDLNQLREARGLDPVSLAGSDLLNEIIDERRRELAFEGHRWFDIKRLGRVLEKPEATGASPLLPDDFRFLSAIPNNQVVASNGVIIQNPGYTVEEED